MAEVVGPDLELEAVGGDDMDVAAEAGVVELALLGILERVVGLGELLEALLEVGPEGVEVALLQIVADALELGALVVVERVDQDRMEARCGRRGGGDRWGACCTGRAWSR